MTCFTVAWADLVPDIQCFSHGQFNAESGVPGPKTLGIAKFYILGVIQ